MVSTPFEKYESKGESSPNRRGENKKCLSCHHLVHPSILIKLADVQNESLALQRTFNSQNSELKKWHCFWLFPAVGVRPSLGIWELWFENHFDRPGRPSQKKNGLYIIGLVFQYVFKKSELVGGFNPSEKYETNGIISPGRDQNKEYLKRPPKEEFNKPTYHVISQRE